MHNNIMVAQSGGPTCAINASLAGVIREGLLQEKIGKIYGSLGGILGVLNGQIIDLAAQVKTDARLSRLERTPAMALGSCRYCMPDADSDPAVYEQILSVFHDYGIGYFFYIGGNDSMDTALKLSDYFKLRGEVICVVGIPKTIDNDLFGTDHSPGYGSAAKFIATSMSEMARDCGVYSVNSVTIAEIMGRNTGWLTAAAVLPRAIGHDVPQLVYLPEAPFDIERFLQDISRVHKTHRSITVAISEGIRFEDGRYVSESEQGGQMDPFGHRYLSGAGKLLERIVARRIGCKVRSVELNILQRSAAHLLSATDIDESVSIGRRAVAFALEGRTGVMAAYRRVSDTPYAMEIDAVDLRQVAGLEKKFPREWISPAGNDLTDEVFPYLLPLIAGKVDCHTCLGMPAHLVLDKTPLENPSHQ